MKQLPCGRQYVCFPFFQAYVFLGSRSKSSDQNTLPETNIAHENPIFPGKYHQNCRFSMAMLVYRSVHKNTPQDLVWGFHDVISKPHVPDIQIYPPEVKAVFFFHFFWGVIPSYRTSVSVGLDV